MGNFVEPLSDIADEFLAHLGAIKDESGDVYDLQPELNKWAFQGNSHRESYSLDEYILNHVQVSPILCMVRKLTYSQEQSMQIRKSSWKQD